MMQVSKRVPFEDPQVLMGVRILYVVSNLIIFGINYYIGMKIKKTRGESNTGILLERKLTQTHRYDNTEICRACSDGVRGGA
jgi:Phosphate transport (Pho88)